MGTLFFRRCSPRAFSNDLYGVRLRDFEEVRGSAGGRRITLFRKLLWFCSRHSRCGGDIESPAQMAEDQVKVEEKQRVLGVIPNFYVTYLPHAAPLTPKLKFQLAWKSILNPYHVWNRWTASLELSRPTTHSVAMDRAPRAMRNASAPPMPILYREHLLAAQFCHPCLSKIRVISIKERAAQKSRILLRRRKFSHL